MDSLALEFKTFAREIRGPSRMENNCYRVLDVTCRKEESRTREKCALGNIACPTGSRLKRHPSRQSLTTKPRGCGWRIEFLTAVETGISTSYALAPRRAGPFMMALRPRAFWSGHSA